jgi:hypothetical protein
MSKYQELTGLAIAHTRKFHEAMDDCTDFLTKLMKDFATYLGCPKERIYFLSPKNSSKIFRVELQSERDGFFYARAEILFDAASPGQIGQYFAKVSFLLGVKKVGDYYVLRADKDFTIHPGNTPEANAFYDHFYEDTRQYYKTPQGEPQKRLGFHLPGAD